MAGPDYLQPREETVSGLAEECSLWFSFSVTYDFLATEDINRDRIQDVLFLYKSTKGSSHFNLSCADEGNFVFTPKRRCVLGGGLLPLSHCLEGHVGLPSQQD